MDSRYASIQGENSGIALDDFVTRTIDTPSTRTAKDGMRYASVPTEPFDEFDNTDERKPPLESTEALTGRDPRDPLPPVDIGSGTKLQCLLTIVFGTLSFLACILCSIGLWVKSRTGPVHGLPRGIPGEALSFIVNIILTQCLEGLAYIHSISLRWALLKENRLVFNTNIRLIASSKISRANSWYINCISAIILILCYGCTSMLFIPGVDAIDGTFSETARVNLIALLALGIALCGQTLVAVWCYFDNLRDIPTWSSNPLNTTVTMLDQQFVQHREGRCLHSLQIQRTSEGTPVRPRARQPSQWEASTTARHAIIFIWLLAALSFVWFLTVVLVARTDMRQAINQITPRPNSTWHFSLAWSPSENTAVNDISYTTYFNAVFFSLDYVEQGEQNWSFVTELIVGLVFVCVIQGLQTLGLHCAELIVNLSRDEDAWRSLNSQGRSTSKTSVLEKPPFLAALFSWKYVMLSLFKSLLHWLLGQASQPSVDEGHHTVWFTMSYSRLFVYVICAAAFASALTFLVFVQPKGPQPATYGHIQTLADVIDEWKLNEDGHFWWGDKGSSGVRHAGMSSKKEHLRPIQMEALYAG